MLQVSRADIMSRLKIGTALTHTDTARGPVEKGEGVVLNWSGWEFCLEYTSGALAWFALNRSLCYFIDGDTITVRDGQGSLAHQFLTD